MNTEGSFKCDCAPGYNGPRCEQNINECISNPCQNEGTCLDDVATWRCICMPGMILLSLCLFTGDKGPVLCKQTNKVIYNVAVGDTSC